MAAFNVQLRNVYYGQRRESHSLNVPTITDEADCTGCGCFGNSSGTSGNRVRLEKERIKQYSIWRLEMEEDKAREYARRRLRKKKIRESFSRYPNIRTLRLCYILFFILFSMGMLFTLCSCVKTIGKNTPFYEQRDLYRILGPIILTCAFVMFCVIDGFLAMFKQTLPRHEGVYINKKEQKELLKLADENDRVVPSHRIDVAENGVVTDVLTSSEANTNQSSSTQLVSERIKGWQNKTAWINVSEDCGCSDVGPSYGDEQAPVREAEGHPWEFVSSQSSRRFVYERQISRNASSKSKASTTSQFSDFSETAPLVKKA